MQNAIELRHITKTFGSVVANKDVFLTVRRGEKYQAASEDGLWSAAAKFSPCWAKTEAAKPP